MTRPTNLCAALLGAAAAVCADEPEALVESPLAVAFGSAPIAWGMKLSPDGNSLSQIQVLPDGTTMARVVDFTSGTLQVIVAGKKDVFEVAWCDWANDTRLLCGLRATLQVGTVMVPVTRLVGVNKDGNEQKVLLERRLDDAFTQFQDRIVDWLPEDPDEVLIQIPGGSGSGVARLNVYDGRVATEDRVRPNVFEWISDGYGQPRLYRSVTAAETSWYVRDTPDAGWSLLRESALSDLDEGFTPIGFGERRDELLFFDTNDGRTALFALDLANGRRQRLVYSHPEHDVAGVQALGKYERLVAVSYVDERPHLHFFDERIGKISAAVAALYPDQTVAVLDEDWNQRYYLVFVSSAEDPGAFFRFDSQENVLLRLARAHPTLKDLRLAPMRAIEYPADDGTAIPAYLTVPAGASGPLPAVILPHGGPAARDVWSYDFLVQYLVANGYAVLQSNYRGSTGYGAAWAGEGGFRGWRRAIGDITDGTEYLVREGIADPNRICMVGWSYGGYAALLSVIENKEIYRCVVSVAGVSDPRGLGVAMRNFVGGRQAQAFIGTDEEVRKAGSPLERVAEIGVPVLLFHAEKDVNVPFAQSAAFARSLRRADKDFEFIEYEHAEHDISPERYRIDLLTRLASFLDEHIGE